MFRWPSSFHSWNRLSDVTRICLATAIGAFVAAGLGALINIVIGDWFKSGGMAIVGLFYFILFLANYPPRGVSAIGADDMLKAKYAKPRQREPQETALFE
jgi:hypothetical protein